MVLWRDYMYTIYVNRTELVIWRDCMNINTTEVVLMERLYAYTEVDHPPVIDLEFSLYTKYHKKVTC